MRDRVEPQDRQLLQELAEKQARLQREIRINGALASLSKAIISPDITNAEIHQRLLDQARELTESQHGFVSTVDSGNKAHVSDTVTQMNQGDSEIVTESGAEAEAGAPDEPLRTYHELWGHSLNIHQPFFSNDPAAHASSLDLKEGYLPLKNFLAMPVMYKGELLGQIALADSLHDYNEDDLTVVERLCDLYAIVLHNRGREEELVRLATTDHLTGLWNRRQFMQLGQQEFERVKRYGGTVAVLVFDIDHFKLVNDNYGHKTGDEVLRGTAGIVLARLRSMDFAGRLGGEEFAIVLPETSLPDAMSVAERLRAAIEGNVYRPDAGRTLFVTASFGVDEIAGSDKSFEGIIFRADNAMYQAKAAGRNRVCTIGGQCIPDGGAG